MRGGELVDVLVESRPRSASLPLSYSPISVVAPLIDRIDESEDALQVLEGERASSSPPT